MPTVKAEDAIAPLLLPTPICYNDLRLVIADVENEEAFDGDLRDALKSTETYIDVKFVGRGAQAEVKLALRQSGTFTRSRECDFRHYLSLQLTRK